MAPRKRRRLTANSTTSQQTHSNSIDQALVTHNGNVEGVQYETTQLCPSIMTASLNEDAVVRVASKRPVRPVLPSTLSNVTTRVIPETKDTKRNYVTAVPPWKGPVRPVLPSTLSNVTTRDISETKDTRPNHAAAAPPWKPSKAEKTLIAGVNRIFHVAQFCVLLFVLTLMVYTGSIIGQQKRYDEAVQQHLNNNPSLQNHPGTLAEFEYLGQNNFIASPLSKHQIPQVITHIIDAFASLWCYMPDDRDIVLMIEDRPESAQLLSTLMQDMKNVYGTELIPLQEAELLNFCNISTEGPPNLRTEADYLQYWLVLSKHAPFDELGCFEIKGRQTTSGTFNTGTDYPEALFANLAGSHSQKTFVSRRLFPHLVQKCIGNRTMWRQKHMSLRCLTMQYGSVIASSVLEALCDLSLMHGSQMLLKRHTLTSSSVPTGITSHSEKAVLSVDHETMKPASQAFNATDHQESASQYFEDVKDQETTLQLTQKLDVTKHLRNNAIAAQRQYAPLLPPPATFNWKPSIETHRDSERNDRSQILKSTQRESFQSKEPKVTRVLPPTSTYCMTHRVYPLGIASNESISGPQSQYLE